MKIVKSNSANLQRCKKLIQSFKKDSSKVNMNEWHSFIVNVDKFSLRTQTYFKPLQNIMKERASLIVNDNFVLSQPKMIAQTSSLMKHLNYYNQNWIKISLVKFTQFIKKDISIKIEDSLPVYQLCIQLGYSAQDSSFFQFRQFCLKLVQKEIESRKYKLDSFFVEKIHSYLNLFMFDPSFDPAWIKHSLTLLSKYFNPQSISLGQKYNYAHTAKFCQLIGCFSMKIENQFYYQFLQKCSNQYLTFIDPVKGHQNTSEKFARRGNSIFQIRFQKILEENNYWFERNKIVGLYQYDILLKGKKGQDYFPLQRLAQYSDISQAETISEKELQTYAAIDDVWKINTREKWKQPILINLNGPFHEIVGDKSGTLRSESIKQLLITKHGYKNFKTIDYQDWQKKTPNKINAKAYMENILTEFDNLY